MAQETERKFLVKGEFKSLAQNSTRIIQGYLSSVPERTVRIRLKDDKGFITIKGAPNASGLSRYEWEKEIAPNDAKELLNLCEPHIIHKTRFRVKSGRHTFEVDEFYDENEGLILAELELESEEELFEKPPWLGKEVTGDHRYYNAWLAKHPFSKK
ncbi:MAG: CYTH domain-containing protein [Lentimicrobiaceae bacterium]|nr:CYTH domain-containing protein [Lentimicrobiaceae bacterium]